VNGPPPAIDMRGIRIGRWLVTGKAESRKRRAWWVCVCDCGVIMEMSGTDLRAGRPRRCSRCDG
jgi:hypothetical protein